MSHDPILRSILEHVSVRRFKPDPMPDDVVKSILKAGQRAPSSGLFQTYSFIIVNDREKRAKIAEVTGQKFVKKAPLFILICVDLRRFRKVLDYLGHDYHLKHGYGLYAKLFSIVDASLAAQNMAIAASCYGLGTCFVGAIFYRMDEVAAILGLPEGVLPLMGLCIGYPAETPPLRPRWPLESITHIDSYRDVEDDEITRFLDEAERKLGEEGYYMKYARKGYGYIEHLKWKTQISDWIKERDDKIAEFMRKNGFNLT